MRKITDVSTVPDWSKADCRDMDPDLWFPGPGDPARDARVTCLFCPLRAECLEYAQVNMIGYGIWGGLVPNERQALRVASSRLAAAS